MSNEKNQNTQPVEQTETPVFTAPTNRTKAETQVANVGDLTTVSIQAQSVLSTEKKADTARIAAVNSDVNNVIDNLSVLEKPKTKKKNSKPKNKKVATKKSEVKKETAKVEKKQPIKVQKPATKPVVAPIVVEPKAIQPVVETKPVEVKTQPVSINKPTEQENKSPKPKKSKKFKWTAIGAAAFAALAVAGITTGAVLGAQSCTDDSWRVFGSIDGTDWEGWESGSFQPENYEINNSAKTIIYSGNTNFEATNLVIPNSIQINNKNYTVVIGASMFNQNSSPSNLSGSLTITEGITSIGDLAFYGCNGLNGTLSIPNGIAYIGTGAFTYCRFTGELNIPGSVITISSTAFSGCSHFTSLVLNEGISSIGASAFESCWLMSGTLTIPDSVSWMGVNAFKSCEGFDSLVIGSGLDTIMDCVFQYCTGFIGILDIPRNIERLGWMAFYGCTGFDTVVIPSSINETFGTIMGGDAAGNQIFGYIPPAAGWGTRAQTIIFDGWNSAPTFAARAIFSDWSDGGEVYSINGTWTSSEALGYCQTYQNLPGGWTAA